MEVVHIVTPKYEYVCKIHDLKRFFGHFDRIRIDEDVCQLHYLRMRDGRQQVILNPIQGEKEYRKYVDLNPAHIIEIRTLDQNGPFYKSYLKAVSNLVLPKDQGVKPIQPALKR